MKVADAMTPGSELVTVSLPGSRDDVLEYLQERKFSSVPVLGEGGGYRGLVSRDHLIEHPNEDDLALVMREVSTTTPDATLEEVAELMRSTESRRIPVVEEQNGKSLAGIITITDIVRTIARGNIEADVDVRDLCRDDINATYEGTPLPVAEREIGLANVPYTIVLDDKGEMSGMLTEVDIVAVARVVEGEEDAGAAMAGDDEDWKWESIQSVGNRYIPTRNVEFPVEPVSTFMTENVVTISGRKTAQDAAKLMLSNDIEQLPVLGGGELAGVVRDSHLLEAV
ncbi:MAG: CBS domain-containing protein [Halolamina sp.]|uniref:CBS domain-containing protein n=1 Tax=Halolamina sp. TaxID=1940283 RepID=UPI002FC2C24A